MVEACATKMENKHFCFLTECMYCECFDDISISSASSYCTTVANYISHSFQVAKLNALLFFSVLIEPTRRKGGQMKHTAALCTRIEDR